MSKLGEITPEIRKAWQECHAVKYGIHAQIMADALESVLAALRRTEFWRVHDEHEPENCWQCNEDEGVDAGCHNWEDTQWLVDARCELEGK